MQSVFISLAIVFAVFLSTQAYQLKDDDRLVELCKKSENRELCEYLLQQDNYSDDYEHGMMEKRKPSFVRFGKRSSNLDNQDMMQMDKRKPSFVRFG
ncbi:unnamed protein product [Auanema sp. JU1783]|nr:unnamed protein product [Auanema sp. JU1783]